MARIGAAEPCPAPNDAVIASSSGYGNVAAADIYNFTQSCPAFVLQLTRVRLKAARTI
jgi:hypothetical protein